MEIDLERMYHFFSNIHSEDDKKREFIIDFVYEVDSSRTDKIPEKLVDYLVYIDNRSITRLERRARHNIPIIIGDNGDGKSTLLKALETKLKDKNAIYVDVDKLEGGLPEGRPLIDKLDEHVIRDDKEGDLGLDRKAYEIINEVIARDFRLYPVIALTTDAHRVILARRWDAKRRMDVVMNLTKHEYRKKAAEFIFKRDVLVFLIDKRKDYSTIVKVVRLLEPEIEPAVKRKRTPGMLHRLYRDLMDEISEDQYPSSTLEKATERHADFEQIIYEAVNDSTKRIAKALNLVLEAQRKGGKSEPDVEISILTPSGESKIAIECKFQKNITQLSYPSYAKDYSALIFVVASTKDVAELPDTKLYRIPYSLGALMVLNETARYNFADDLDFGPAIIWALSKIAEKSPTVENEIVSIYKIAVEFLKSRRGEDGKTKAFQLRHVKNIAKDVDPHVVLETIESVCPGLIYKSSSRYRIDDAMYDECIKKLEKLAGLNE